MMTPEEYLDARGWTTRYTNCAKLTGDHRPAIEWIDPVTGERIQAESIDEAVAIQVRRDHDCAEFAAANHACNTLDLCDAANAAMARAKADGLDGDAVRVVGERVMAGVSE